MCLVTLDRVAATMARGRSRHCHYPHGAPCDTTHCRGWCGDGAGLRRPRVTRYRSFATFDYTAFIEFAAEAAVLLDMLRTRKPLIEAACRQYGARRIRVFGSVARREEGPDSDIDFLVDFPHGYDLFAQRLPLAERLAEITGRRLDLLPEHELNRHMRAHVLQEAVDL